MSIPWKDIVERAGWTAIQSAAGAVTTGGTAVALSTFDWRSVAAGVATATLMSLIKGILSAIGQPAMEELVDQLIVEAVAAIEAAHKDAVPAPGTVPAQPAPPRTGEVPVAAIAQTSALPQVPRRPSRAPLDPGAVSARGGH